VARPARRHRARGRDAEELAPFAQQRGTVDPELLPESGRRRVELCLDRLDAFARPLGQVRAGQWKTSPPFTSIAAPVTITDRSDARNNAARAHSSSVGMTPSEMFDAISA
jgi:hypothetical protein